MDIQPADEQPTLNPYNFETMLQNAALSLRANRQVEVVRETEAGVLKTYTMEEAKSLEIVPFKDENPFGELDQDFASHFNEMVAGSEAISAEKKRMGNALTIGAAPIRDYTVKDLARAFVKDENRDAIAEVPPRSQQDRAQGHQGFPKSDE